MIPFLQQVYFSEYRLYESFQAVQLLYRKEVYGTLSKIQGASASTGINSDLQLMYLDSFKGTSFPQEYYTHF